MSRRFQFRLRDQFLLMLGFAFYFLSLSHGGSLFSAVAMTVAFVVWFPLLSRR